MRDIFVDHTHGTSTTVTWDDHEHGEDVTDVAVANGGTESASVHLSSQFLDVDGTDCDSYRDITVDTEVSID